MSISSFFLNFFVVVLCIIYVFEAVLRLSVITFVVFLSIVVLCIFVVVLILFFVFLHLLAVILFHYSFVFI